MHSQTSALHLLVKLEVPYQSPNTLKDTVLLKHSFKVFTNKLYTANTTIFMLSLSFNHPPFFFSQTEFLGVILVAKGLQVQRKAKCACGIEHQRALGEISRPFCNLKRGYFLRRRWPSAMQKTVDLSRVALLVTSTMFVQCVHSGSRWP